MKTITLDEMKSLSENLKENEILLDVRSIEEFEEFRIAGAKNIPHTDVEDHSEELKKYGQVYIFCRMGGRAKFAYDALTDEGLTNVTAIVDAGMEAWKERGYPLDGNV